MLLFKGREIMPLPEWLSLQLLADRAWWVVNQAWTHRKKLHQLHQTWHRQRFESLQEFLGALQAGRIRDGELVTLDARPSPSARSFADISSLR